MRRIPLVAAALFVSCSSSPPPAPTPVEQPLPSTSAVEEEPASFLAPPEADGVMAEREGLNGVKIRVVHEKGVRRLIIGDTVHAAVPWTEMGPAPASDPMVKMLRILRPKAKKALVIGLGSGRTAMTFVSHGFEVTSVEIEPVVIELARDYFGFEGKAIAADGAKYLEAAKESFDVVLMDAFSGTEAPASLMSGKARSKMRRAAGEGGVVAYRLLTEPGSAVHRKIFRPIQGSPITMGFRLELGSGIGVEKQNIYLFESREPLNTSVAEGLAMWPLASSAALKPTKAEGNSRTISVTGYVHRLEGGELALDVPHPEMGAIRFLLKGDASQGLAEKLGTAKAFPTAGDIRSDGDLSKTLAKVFGGGGAKRNEVRFSTLSAMVTGTAKVLATVEPDASARMNFMRDKNKKFSADERIPYGGTLYALDISSVHWSLDLRTWKALQRQNRKKLSTALSLVRAGKTSRGGNALAAYVNAVARGIGESAEDIPLLALINDAANELNEASDKALPFDQGAACDRAAYRFTEWGPGPAVRKALMRCAVTHYKRVIRKRTNEDAKAAAARLIVLLEPSEEDRRTAREIERLGERFDVEPNYEPPKRRR